MKATELQIQPGWDVYGSDDEKIGSIVEVGPNYLMVEKGFLFVTDLYIPSSAVNTIDAERECVYLTVAKDEVEAQGWTQQPSDSEEWAGWAARRQSRMTTPGGDTTRIPRHEEELRASKSREQIGQVNVRKDVVEEQQSLDVPVTRDEVQVERRRVDRPGVADESAFREESVTVPVHGERVDVHKEPRVVEEVEVSKAPREERREVAGTVRREEIDVDASGDAGMQGRGTMPNRSDDEMRARREKGGEHGTEALGGAAGAVGGAAIGGAVGGPPGAVVGGAAGAAAGAAAGEATEGDEKAGSGAGGAAGAVGGAALGGAVAGPPGAVVGGAVGGGAGAGAGDKTQERQETDLDEDDL